MAYRLTLVIKDEDLQRARRVLQTLPKMESWKIDHVGEVEPKSKRVNKMSEARQLAIIYGSVLFSSFALFMFIEWGTRP